MRREGSKSEVIEMPTDVDSRSAVNKHTVPVEEPRKGYFLIAFTILSGLTIAAAALVLLNQIVNLFAEKFSLIDAILQCYLIMFAVLVALTELEWTGVVRNSIICQSWIIRGLVYMFIGTLVVKEDIPNDILVDTILGNINNFCGYVFVAFGGVYFVLGLLCIKRMRDRKMARYITLLAYNEARNASGSSANETTPLV